MTTSRGIRKRDPNTYELRRMVDAIREMLGLDPLYNDPRATDAQRFVPQQHRAWAGFNPDGNRVATGHERAG